MLKAIVLSVLIVGTLSGTVPAPIPQQNLNNGSTGAKDVAGGRYYGENGYNYPPGPGWGYPWDVPAFDPPIVDDYICDLNAAVLVVTNANDNNDEGFGNGRDDGYGDDRRRNNNGGYGVNNDGYGHGHGHGHGHRRDNDDTPNADRLKCSVIAEDHHSCEICCHLAARRDRSIPQKDIVGFIVDNNQIERNQNNRDNESYRAKRQEIRDGLCVCCTPRKFGLPHFDSFRHHNRGGY